MGFTVGAALAARLCTPFVALRKAEHLDTLPCPFVILVEFMGLIGFIGRVGCRV